jgi:hypothetical protein
MNKVPILINLFEQKGLFVKVSQMAIIISSRLLLTPGWEAKPFDETSR